MLCLATAALVLAPPLRAGAELAPSLSMVSAAAPVQLGAMPSSANELRITGLGGSSAQWTIVVLMTFLTLIPSMLICMTPFARLLIVFHFLRQALGLQTTPSNQTLIGLSVIMTFFLIQPLGDVIYRDSIVPLQEGKITAVDALVRDGYPDQFALIEQWQSQKAKDDYAASTSAKDFRANLAKI